MDEDVRVIEGDCLSVLPTLAGEPIAAVVTDPPYGIGNTRNRARPSKWQRAAGLEPREWDQAPADVMPLLDISPKMVIWGGNYYPLPPSRGWIVWYKPDAPPSMSPIEMAWTQEDRNSRHITHSIGATNAERVWHPTQKPLAVMRASLEFLRLPPGSLVLDPYAGSGTTGVACLKAGLRCILIESDPRYIPIINRRIAEARTPLFDAIEAGAGEVAG
jgi:site-specific DNA-methyltransferase (adenine-specific)/modification methylase